MLRPVGIRLIKLITFHGLGEMVGRFMPRGQQSAEIDKPS